MWAPWPTIPIFNPFIPPPCQQVKRRDMEAWINLQAESIWKYNTDCFKNIIFYISILKQTKIIKRKLKIQATLDRSGQLRAEALFR